MRSFPGPNIFSLLSNAISFKKDPLAQAQTFLNTYGDAIEIQVAWMPIMAFNTVEYYDEILRKKYQHFPKSEKYKELSALMGEGLTTSEGDFWKQNRSSLQKLFTPLAIETYLHKLDSIALDYIDKIGESKQRDFYQDMMQFALASITSTLFNKDYSQDSLKISQALQDFMSGMEDRIFQILPGMEYLPTAKNKRYQNSIKILKDQIKSIISEKRTHGFEKETDLVSLLLQAQQDSTKFKITDQYIEDEVMTFFLAGHETTASALTWLIGLLSTNPTYQRRVQDEIDQNLNIEFTSSDINNLSLLDNCLNEALRLYPPLWMTSRQANKSETLGGKKVPKGTIIVLSPYFLHRNTKYWTDPETFYPERFEKPLVHKDSFQPFGIGPRGCIGERFSRLEIKILVIRLLQNYNFKLKAGYKLEAKPTITMRPKNGLPIEFERRKNDQ
ncbi:MAG: hypothetical protein CME65_10790 [Halobacteriovoraceae bacterium]|nr:hypothetical protein [Halobacteriovoraceae bacterium]|tara:strand:+ start:11018 stop:12349 length:1332 start_codon:yes stop_codon:yes gene_type:complete